MRSLFSYCGNKTKMLKDILPMIPEHKIYIEPFVGGGAVFWAKDKAEINVLGDVNEHLMNAYQGLIIGNCDEIREMYPETLEKQQEFVDDYDGEESKAFMYFYIKAHGTFMSKNTAKKIHMLVSRSKLNNLEKYQDKIDGTVLIFGSYEVSINGEHNTKDAFWFIDPPYEGSKYCNYYVENDCNYVSLVNNLKLIKGKFLVTLNHSEYLENLFGDFNRKVVDVKSGHSGMSNGVKNYKAVRRELIITNY